MLFSATFKKRVERAAAEILTDPIRITVGTVGEVRCQSWSRFAALLVVQRQLMRSRGAKLL